MKGLEGQQVGKYELLRAIGQGSMGTVYLARDPFSLGEAAVKVVALPEGEKGDERRRQRKLFLNESKAAGLLHHPNIVATLDVGVDDGYGYIAMEYLPSARTLEVHCQPGNLLAIELVAAIMFKCAIACDYAHNKGVVHRDLKPLNILVSDEREVKICDFGLAFIDRSDVEHTQVIGTLGSPRYMAPEQMLGHEVSNQTDIFALGVILYQLLTGVHPFGSDNLLAVAQRIAREPHAPMRSVRAEIPIELDRVVDRALKKHPAGRYQRAIDLAGDLAVIHDKLELAARTVLHDPRSFTCLRGLRFFDAFAESELEEVLGAGELLRFAPGERVIAEGSADAVFFVLVSGEALLRHEGRDVYAVKPGASFGELGYLREPAAGDAIARTEVCALAIRSKLIERASAACRLQVQKALLRSVAHRASRTLRYIGRHRAR
jgi:hypothetical protein